MTPLRLRLRPNSGRQRHDLFSLLHHHQPTQVTLKPDNVKNAARADKWTSLPSATCYRNHKCAAVAEMDERLAARDMGRKLGVSAPFWGGGARSLSNTMSLGSRPTFLPSGILIYRAIWPQQIWDENFEGAVPFGERELGPARAEAYQHAKFHLDPSNRLATIHQRHRQDRTDRQTDNGPIAEGEPFYKRSPKNCS